MSKKVIETLTYISNFIYFRSQKSQIQQKALRKLIK